MYAPTSTAEFLTPPAVCPDPATPDNGKLNLKGRWIGATARYTCDDGKELVGSALRRCNADGTWTGKPVFCESVKTCGDNAIPALAHGMQIKSPASNGRSFELVANCEPGYKLAGLAKRTCNTDTGLFNGVQPVCKKDCGTVPVAPAFATLSNPAGTTYAGTKVSYTCNAGYQISGATTVSELTCLDYGVWSGVPPACAPITCPKPTAVKNADMSVNGQSIGSQAQYMCQPGYEMEHSAENMETNAEVSAVSRCTNNGVWTPPPACVQKRICSHVYCVLQANHHVEVRHHNGEAHGAHHQCSYKKGADKCTCQCWE